ncbi:MAG TPA: phosphate acyltransferase PlsX [Chitinispirillaceae bacterium]|nr:phosphate acyltransferase PlsX [Chitinispirillaceae bacterium]
MKEIRLAIDVESGDYGSKVLISGLLEARKLCKTPFKAWLCGDRNTIEEVLSQADFKNTAGNIEIVHCSDAISPQDQRARVWKKKADSSIVRCITLQKEGVVDASISAGDTAILMGAALFILGRSEGAVRPALAAFLPTVKQKPVLLLDVGANLNCRTDHLVSFALLGHSYVMRYLQKESVAVALLSIGTEPMKGTRVICDAGEILKKKCIDYIGFIEGNDVLTGEADVVVCDGFTGNVLLKACESIHVLVKSIFRKKTEIIKNHMSIFDPEIYGAAPFLGIKGTVLKAHGGSSSRAIAHAILAAVKAVQLDAVWSKAVRPKGV